MDILNVKSGNEWVGIPAMQGPQGAKGDKGDKGDNGQDGFSPTVSVTPVSGGQRITITDATGPHTADILNGDPSSLIAVQNTEPQGSDVQLWIDDTNAPEGIQVPTYEEHLEGLAQKAPIIIDSKSGNPIVINDGIPGLKLYDMKVSFGPKQAGTGDPSPTNIRPITGWDGMNIHRSGKNLVQFSDHMGPSATFYNGYSGWLTNGYWRIPNMSIKYTYSAYIDNKNASQSSCAKIWFFGADGTTSAGFVEGTQVAAGAEGWSIVSCGNNANRYFAAFGLGLQSGGIASQGMVEIGETQTDYEPYSGTVIPISWQTEAGTVYGGELDVSSGELIVTHIMISDIWGNIPKSDPTTETGLTSGYLDFPENVEQCVSQSKYGASTYCNMCATIIWGNATFTPMHYYINTQNRVWMAFPTDLDSSTPIQIVGKLVTPRVVNIDPIQISLLVGANTIWTDADTAEIAYPVDTKKYIDAGARDVRINGTSILGDGVANIPVAYDTRYGVVKASVNTTYGVVIDQGLLKTSPAGVTNIKAGTASRMPIVPQHQHEAIFYGLAKLAGVDLANETVTLGQYPSTALVAIRKMLGVYEAPWEIINEETFTNESEADYIITVDRYGQPFELTEAMMLFELPKLSIGDVDSSKGNYGQIWFIYDNGNKYIAPEPGSFTRVADGDAKGSWYRIQNNNGLIISMATVPTTNTNSGTLRLRYIQNGWSGMGVFVDDGTFAITSVNIRGVTGNGKYRLYGRRKWT